LRGGVPRGGRGGWLGGKKSLRRVPPEGAREKKKMRTGSGGRERWTKKILKSI